MEANGEWCVEVLAFGHWILAFPYLRLELAIAEAVAYAPRHPENPLRLRQLGSNDTIPVEVL